MYQKLAFAPDASCTYRTNSLSVLIRFGCSTAVSDATSVTVGTSEASVAVTYRGGPESGLRGAACQADNALPIRIENAGMAGSA